VLVSREQDVKTVLKRNEGYWGKGSVPLGITEITYLVIKSDATRVAALLSGDVDFVQEVPVQDIDRLEKSPNLKINLGPENRTIFFGMNVGSPELATSSVKGKNPFADKRVRHAINLAIDREAIKRAVMRGQAVPAGIIAPPFVNGYSKALDTVPKVDIAKATALLKDAGYPNGFDVTLHCPNDRYINDEAICQAGSAMLAKIGIKVNLMAQPKGPHFTLIQKNPPETDFFLLGWGVPTYDSHYIFSFLYHTRAGSEGSWNATRFSNTEIDSAIRSLSSEVNDAKRNATIATIWKELADETIYIALHHQMLAYAMKRDLDIPVSTDNTVHMKFVAAK
jgi:peptide/nickel transport system substrate-binding protein